MKLCYITPHFPSQYPETIEATQGIFEYRQINNLVKRGHEVKVIAIKWNGQTEHEDYNKISIYRIPYIFLFRDIRYPIPNFWYLIRKIKEVISSFKPDVVVYSHMEYLTALPIFLNYSPKVPVIVTTDCIPGISWNYGDKIVDLFGYLYSKCIGKKIFQRADGIQLLSGEVLGFVNKLNLTEEKFFVIPRGTDTSAFMPRPHNDKLKQNLGIKSGDIVVTFVGRLDLVKGVNYLIIAAKDILQNNDLTKFLLIGDGSLKNKFKSMSKEFPNNIIFLGYREDIPEILSISDIFILPSLSEGAANVILEASATALPVIASRVGQIPDIILDGKTGILVEPKDVPGLIKALNTLITNPMLRIEMGTEGRIRILQNYTWEIICEKIEGKYSEILLKHNSLADFGGQYR